MELINRAVARASTPRKEAPLIVKEIGGAAAQWRIGADGTLDRVPAGDAAAGGTAAPRASFAARVSAELCSVFLPVGYPDSVRSEYLRFQAFDTLQAACSYLRNILTTSAILRGAGVGEDRASPMAAAIAWVLRDGFGMFGSLVFSYLVGTGFDRNVKEWRLFADLINDVGLTLDMLAPLAGPSGGTNFMVVAALGACCKTICGMTAGATRASITAHFALRDNLADVSAKEGAQETAVTLLGLLVGSALAGGLGDSPRTTWAAFVLLTLVHVWANTLGVGCLALDTINRQRAAILARRWWRLRLRADDSSSSSAVGVGVGGAAARAAGAAAAAQAAATKLALSPREVAKEERLWGPLLLWLRGPRVGVGVASLVDLGAADGGAAELRELERIHRDDDYLLSTRASGGGRGGGGGGGGGGGAWRGSRRGGGGKPGRPGTPAIALRPQATGATVLRALLHASWLDEIKDGKHPIATPEEAVAATQAEWGAFVAALRGAGWPVAAVGLEGEGRTRVVVSTGRAAQE